MSVLILGGRDSLPIKAVLHSLGCDEVIHWNEVTAEKHLHSLPSRFDRLVLLSRNGKTGLTRTFLRQLATSSLPIIRAKDDPSCLYQTWVERYGTPENCLECDGCQETPPNSFSLLGGAR